MGNGPSFVANAQQLWFLATSVAAGLAGYLIRESGDD